MTMQVSGAGAASRDLLSIVLDTRKALLLGHTQEVGPSRAQCP